MGRDEDNDAEFLDGIKDVGHISEGGASTGQLAVIASSGGPSGEKTGGTMPALVYNPSRDKGRPADTLVPPKRLTLKDMEPRRTDLVESDAVVKGEEDREFTKPLMASKDRNRGVSLLPADARGMAGSVPPTGAPAGASAPTETLVIGGKTVGAGISHEAAAGADKSALDMLVSDKDLKGEGFDIDERIAEVDRTEGENLFHDIKNHNDQVKKIVGAKTELSPQVLMEEKLAGIVVDKGWSADDLQMQRPELDSQIVEAVMSRVSAVRETKKAEEEKTGEVVNWIRMGIKRKESTIKIAAFLASKGHTPDETENLIKCACAEPEKEYKPGDFSKFLGVPLSGKKDKPFKRDENIGQVDRTAKDREFFDIKNHNDQVKKIVDGKSPNAPGPQKKTAKFMFEQYEMTDVDDDAVEDLVEQAQEREEGEIPSLQQVIDFAEKFRPLKDSEKKVIEQALAEHYPDMAPSGDAAKTSSKVAAVPAQDLIPEIAMMTQEGKPEEVIRQELMARGYASEDIEAALNQTDAAAPPTQQAQEGVPMAGTPEISAAASNKEALVEAVPNETSEILTMIVSMIDQVDDPDQKKTAVREYRDMLKEVLGAEDPVIAAFDKNFAIALDEPEVKSNRPTFFEDKRRPANISQVEEPFSGNSPLQSWTCHVPTTRLRSL